MVGVLRAQHSVLAGGLTCSGVVGPAEGGSGTGSMRSSGEQAQLISSTSSNSRGLSMSCTQRACMSRRHAV